MAAVVLVVLGLQAWASWQRLLVADRILAVTAASRTAFTAMHNLRVDRASTVRALNGAEPLAVDERKYLQDIRAAEMPALHATVEQVQHIDLGDNQALFADLQRITKSWDALQTESWEASGKPKAARREDLTKQYSAEGVTLIDTLDKLSARMFASVK